MKAYATVLSLVGATFLLAGGLAYLLNPEEAWLALADAGIGLAAVVAAGLLNPDLFRQYSRWLNTVWGGVMVLAIIVVVNFLADRYPQRLDATAGKLHSLSELTIESLQRLDSEVQALAFMEKGENEALESLLKQYAVHGSNFSFELIDPDRDPERTKEYGIRSYNTLVIESGPSQQKITELTEKEITNALLKVVRNRREVVYMTVGHGEKGVGPQQSGYSRFKERIEEIDYVLEDSLFIARDGRVPEDCSVLVIAGPQSPFLGPEVDALRDYLRQGGSVLAFLDPPFASGLGQLLGEWGVSAGDDFVIDTSGIGSLMGLDYTTPVAMSYDQAHPIVRKHRAGVMTFFEFARSVRFEGAAEGYLGVDLVFTSEQSWGETDLTVLQANPGKRTVKLDEGVDRPGPVSLAAAVRDSAGAGGRLVVFGDSDFASNNFFDLQGNGDLALNALSWLAEDEELISIRPRDPGFNPIALTARQSDWIFWLTIAYPLCVAVVGYFVVSRTGRWSLRDLATVGLGIVLSLGIVVLVNYISDSYNARFDMTEDQLYTLSSDTRDLLDRVGDQEKRISVKTFMSSAEGIRFQDTMKEYKAHSRRFDYKVVDPQKAALEVKQYGIRERGTSIVEVSGDGKVQSERFTEQTEEALSNAIQRALKAQERRIAFTEGHGEGELGQVDGEGFSILNGRLAEMNFQVEEGLRLTAGSAPGAQVVAVLSPNEPFSPDEVAVLRLHLERGGELLLLLDPGPATGLEELLRDYSVDLGQDFVVDLSGIGQLLGADVSVPVVIQYGNHDITESIVSGTMSFFPFSRSVSVDDLGSGGVKAEANALLFTHQSSWGEIDLSPLTGEGGKVEYDPEADRPGPLTLAMAVKADADSASAEGDKARLVVFGDSDFANNQYFGQQANGELLVSSLRWLVEGEDKLSIPARVPRSNPISLADNQGDWVLWISVFILPMMVAMSGFVIMLRRGYETYSAGLVSWLIYNFLAATFFFFAQAVVGVSEGSLLLGEGYLLLAMASAGVAYGLFRRDHRVWPFALGLAIANVGLGFVAIPDETTQLVYSGLFVANACILIWIKRDIVPTEARPALVGGD
mgnify:CR=1 FL=1